MAVTNLEPRTAVVNITIWQGSTFKRTFTFRRQSDNTVIDLTGVTARMDIKDEEGVLLHTLNTTNLGITIIGSNGEVSLKISDADSGAFPPGKYFYDLELIYPPDSDVFKEMAGKFVVKAEVTTSS